MCGLLSLPVLQRLSQKHRTNNKSGGFHKTQILDGLHKTQVERGLTQTQVLRFDKTLCGWHLAFMGFMYVLKS
jgi:hypothetical protein